MDNNLRIEKVGSKSDIKIIETLAKEIWTQHYMSIISKAQIDYMLAKFQSKSAIEKDIINGYIYSLGFLDDVPCAYSAINIEKRGVFLSKFYVKLSFRKKGIAKAMLNIIYTHAKQNSNRIWLTCNKHNADTLKIYMKLGFVIIDECVTDIGNGFAMDDYVLEKKISQKS